MKRAENAPTAAKCLALPVLAGLALTLLLMLGGAFAVNGGKMSGESIPQAALASLAAGTFIAALAAARLAGKSRFLWGLAGGGSLFLCLLVLSLLWIGEPIHLPRTLLVGGCSFIAMLAGSMLGAGLRTKRRKKK